MAYVAEHPELANEACSCSVADDYHCPDNFADVLRRIALDERHHRDQSLDDLRRLADRRVARQHR
jgi:hypothetical protein